MVLPPERFAEIGRIDFHLHSFGNVLPRCSRLFIYGVHLSESPAPSAPSPELLDRPGGLAAPTVHRHAWRSAGSD
jgi:hypothetical protein